MDVIGMIGFIIICSFIYIIFVFYEDQRWRGGYISIWKRLADEQDWLTFYGPPPISSFKDYLLNIFNLNQNYISGFYQNYQFTLDFHRRRSQDQKSRIYTRIRLFSPDSQSSSPQRIDRPDTRLTGDDIINLLLPNGLHRVWSQPDRIIKVNNYGRELTYEAPDFETDINVIQSIVKSLINLAQGYSEVLALGGYAVFGILDLPTGNSQSLKSMADTLLEDIALQSRQRILSKLNRLRISLVL